MSPLITINKIWSFISLASSANLQVIDYISWAIFRKYEHGQENYYEKIEQYIIDEEVMTKERRVNHYEK